MSTSVPHSFRSTLIALLSAAAFLLGFQTVAQAAIDDALTQHIWKLKYGVTDAQLTDATWLNQDTDGDGIKNKDEIAAGTNPFVASNTIKVTSLTKSGSNVILSFPSESGKRYRAERTATVGTGWTIQAGQVIGDGTAKTLTVGYLANNYYRVRVDDVDTDGDGLADWAEGAVLLNPNLVQTVSGTNDYDYVRGQVYADLTALTPRANLVTIRASKPFASEDGPDAGTLTIDRTINLFPITVNYGVSGTAAAGTDYSAFGTTVNFAAHGAASQDLFVNPLASPPATVKGSRAVTATLSAPAAGQPFILGSQTVATVIINPSTVASGTGLLGRYYDTASATYVDAANFGQAGMYSFVRGTPQTTGTIVVTYTGSTLAGLAVGHQVKLSFINGSLNNALYNNTLCQVASVTASTFTVTINAASSFGVTTANGACNFSIQSFLHPPTLTRVDPTINFDWQQGTPNGSVIAPNNSADNYSSTWDTYLQPTIAGDYTFELDADDKAQVLLDTGSGLQEIVQHNWTTPGSDPVGTFKLSAPITLAVPATPAQRYHLQVKHVETTGDARCRLQWRLGTGSFNTIPQASQFSHTQAATYSYSGGNAVITPAGGHSFLVGNTVALAFSSGALLAPGAAVSYNTTYTITAVGGVFPTNTFTVAVANQSVIIPGAATSAGSPTISVPSTAGLAVGMAVSGTGLPANEFITAIGNGLISVTSGTGVAAANTTLTFSLPSTGSTTGSAFLLNIPASTTTGLYNLIYPNTAFTGSPGRVGIDGAVTVQNNGIWNAGTPDAALIQPETFSMRWTGQVQPQFSEEYTFVVQADDGCALWINGLPQSLRMVPSAVTGGSTYTYDSTTGNLVVTYSGLAVIPDSFAVGETVRLDPSSGNLSHAPAVSPTYTYDGATAVVDYTNLTTRTPGSFVAGETVELDPVSGGLFSLSSIPYVILATPVPTATTFAVSIPPTLAISSVSTGNPCVITTVTNHGLANGNTVKIASVTGGTFSTAINGAYPVTVISPTTFSVPTNCTALPASGTGTVAPTVPGNITISDNRSALVTAVTPTTFTVNIGGGKYANASAGNINVDIANKVMKDWSSNGNERYVRIPMVGGVRYDIQLECYENNNAARALLSWYSPSQPKQIVPSERLYPSSLAPSAVGKPALVSATDAEALVGGPFSYTVAGTNGGTVAISGNPAWLTYSGGVLSGTPTAGSGGDYQVLIAITNTAGTSTSVVNLHVDAPLGTVVREYWNGVAGTSVASIPTTTTPSGTANLTSLAGPTDFGDNYGARIRGYLTAPVTGNYYFWVAASNGAELWISNDAEPVNAFKRAWVTTGSPNPQTWSAEVSQKSPWLALEAGHQYYFEVLHKAGTGTGDNLAIGWAKPGEAANAPSQVVPGYVLAPYVAPAPGSTPGTLFVATMLAENGAVTNGVGTATMRLTEDESAVYVKFDIAGFLAAPFHGLSAAMTDWHIHNDPYLTKGTSIMYDPVAPPPNSGLQADGSHKWTIPSTVGSLTKAEVVELIKEGKAYINLHTAAYPAGEIRGNFTLANGTRTFSAPPAPLAWTDDSSTNNGAARFLAQATFGANIADIAALKAIVPAGGKTRYEMWLEDQFTKTPTQHLPEVLAREIGDVFGPFDVRVAFNTWWKTSISGQDQLRQRIAFALSEIHVVSGQGPLEDNSRALADFYDTLATNAFGNFRDILIGTTLTPAMGRYLDMLRNDKPDLAVGRSPNENYAREIKQLFSIGLYRMWPDGSLILTSQDAPVDTYTQREIVGLAHVFTGWDYGYDGDSRTSFFALADWTRPMRDVPARHFTGAKRMLNNEVLPGLTTAGGQALDAYATHLNINYNDPAYQALPAQELNAVHDILFNHPNTGPFICRQLIQRLVTSNPSRDYLYRVVQKFNNNGAGVRGDMQAVIKAIFLDYEARSSDLLIIPAFGKQREPVLRVTNVARAFRPSNITGSYAQSGSNLITITTDTPHLLQANNSIFLEFADTTPAGAQPPPTTGSYPVVSVIDATHYTIAAPGWMTGVYSQSGGSNIVTITMGGHYLPGDNANVIPSPQVLPSANKGRAYFDFTSGTANGLAGFDNTVLTVATSTSFDIPSGVGNSAIAPSINGNTSGTTFTVIAPDTLARSGNVMISRFAGSYQSTGRNGVITIDTAYTSAGSYGQQADHGLVVGDSVFINFANSRDTTSFNETSTENDLVYTVTSVPDPNSYTVAARDAANAAMNADNQAITFPLKAQPLTRSGTIITRQGTFSLDNTDFDLQQTPLNATTVFNYFLPDYKYAGTLASQGITTPEFQLTSETTVVRQANFMYDGIFNPSNLTGISSFRAGSNALMLDLSPWMGLADASAGSVGAVLGAGPQTGQAWTSNANLSTLVDRLNTLLLGGTLPAGAKASILNFIGRPITSIATGTPCTINMGTAHGLAVGDSVTITGLTGGTFSGASTTGNGTFTVASVPAGLNPTTLTLTNVNCSSTTSNGGLSYTNSTLGIIPYTNLTPTPTNIRDRLRAAVHFILTSPDYTIQR